MKDMQEEITFGVWLRKQRRALDLSRRAFADQWALQRWPCAGSKRRIDQPYFGYRNRPKMRTQSAHLPARWLWSILRYACRRDPAELPGGGGRSTFAALGDMHSMTSCCACRRSTRQRGRTIAREAWNCHWRLLIWRGGRNPVCESGRGAAMQAKVNVGIVTCW